MPVLTRVGPLVAVFGALVSAQQPVQWWDLSTVIPHKPSPRGDAAMAVNYSTGHIVLFGGTNTGVPGMYLNDTWVWTGADWVQLSPGHNPPPMSWARMVYDSFNRRNILVGISTDRYAPGPQTWFWNGADWTQFVTSNPSVGAGFSLAYDETNRDVLLFGGGQSSCNPLAVADDTWAFNGFTWEWLGGSCAPAPLGPVPALSVSSTFASPPGRRNAAMSWDRAGGQVVLLSGYNPDISTDWLTDTWVWTGRTTGWQPSAGNPVAPWWGGYQATPYGLGGYLLAVGFPAGTATKIATWKRDATGWSVVDTQGPEVMEGFSISEDPLYGGVLFFGGSNLGTFSDKTWGWGQLPVPLNKAPVAVISPTAPVQCSAAAGANVALNGGSSYDPDGQPIVSYQWTGPAGTAFGKTASMLFPIGLSTVTLAVSDGLVTGTATAGVLIAVGVSGLESPLETLIPMSAPPPPPPAVSFQAGRTLPLKLSLFCGTSKLASNQGRPPRLVSVRYLGNPVQGDIIATPLTTSGDPDGLFRSADDATWIYNFSTQGMTPGMYELAIEMPDGLRYRTLISLR